MKREILSHPLTLIAFFFLLLFAFSEFGPRIPFSVISQSRGEPLVVMGEGKVTAAPDIARVTLGIEETGSSLNQVQTSVNRKSQTLVETIKSLGIEEKDIKTSSYYVSPEYNYESRPARITGYRVSTNYTVIVRDFEKINELLTKATQVGANSVGNISFEVSDENKEKLLEDAREIAVDQARQKAQSLAKAAGINLGKIINIQESQMGAEPPRLMYKEAVGMGGADQAIPQPDIQPGQTDLSVNVSVSWEIR